MGETGCLLALSHNPVAHCIEVGWGGYNIAAGTMFFTEIHTLLIAELVYWGTAPKIWCSLTRSGQLICIELRSKHRCLELGDAH